MALYSERTAKISPRHSDDPETAQQLLAVRHDFFVAIFFLGSWDQDGAPKIAKLPDKWLYGRYNYSQWGL